MPAYLIGNIEVIDAAGYGDYRAKAPATITQCGGRYIARGGAIAGARLETRRKQPPAR